MIAVAMGVILTVVLVAAGVVVQSNTPDMLGFLGVNVRTTTAQVFLTGAICTWALLAASWLLSSGIRRSRARGAELAANRRQAAARRAARHEEQRRKREAGPAWDGMVAGWGGALAGADSATQSAWLTAHSAQWDTHPALWDAHGQQPGYPPGGSAQPAASPFGVDRPTGAIGTAARKRAMARDEWHTDPAAGGGREEGGGGRGAGNGDAPEDPGEEGESATGPSDGFDPGTGTGPGHGGGTRP